MATSSSRGGGFSIGVIYGLIVSIVLYLVLSFMFPINLAEVSVAPSVMENAGVQMPQADNNAAQAPVVVDEIGGGDVVQPVTPDIPATPDSQVAQMSQPEASVESGIAVGGAGDTSPAVSAATQIVSDAGTVAAESAPVLETESTGLPDIGNGAPATEAPVEATVETTITAAAEAPTTQAAPPPAELSETASGPAIEVFAAAFTGDPALPMLAIVLQDTLETSLQPLVDTKQPLSFALMANEDARESAQSIRESGYEVLAMIPPGVSRTEGVAENVARFMQNVPVAVAVIDAPTEGIMLNRNSMREVLATTGPAGLGVVAFAGTGDFLAQDQATRAGAPFGKVVQIIDNTPDEDLILQALDRAAFDAITEGGAIVYAHTRPETINAIVRWLDGPFAQRLQIVPVSAAIRQISN